MTLIDRYAAEVARRLPRSRRADIAEELRSSLLDARESRFGPTASADDEAVLLRELGPPERVAASYGSPSGYLIGPGWFPTFALVLRLHLLSLAGVLVVGAALRLVPGVSTNLGLDLFGLIGGLVQYGLLAFGVIVLVFHQLERSEIRSPETGRDWDPHALPALGDVERVGRGEAITAIVGTAMGLVLLHQLKGLDGSALGTLLPALPPATAASVRTALLLWHAVVRDNLWWLSAGGVLTMAQYWVLLWQGRWRWYTRCSKLAVDGFGVYVAYRVAESIVAEQAAMLQAGLSAEVVAIVVQVVAVAPYVAGAVVVLETAARLARPWRDLGALSRGSATGAAL